MQAFTVGGRVSDEMAIVHIEKGNENIEGIYPFINQQYVEHELTSYKYINREEDMGLPGLRKSKSSYYPVRMIKKYRGKKVMA